MDRQLANQIPTLSIKQQLREIPIGESRTINDKDVICLDWTLYKVESLDKVWGHLCEHDAVAEIGREPGKTCRGELHR